MKKKTELEFETLDSPKFSKLDVENMKRIKGGVYTLNTCTVYSTGGASDDGDACLCDGECDDSQYL